MRQAQGSMPPHMGQRMVKAIREAPSAVRPMYRKPSA